MEKIRLDLKRIENETDNWKKRLVFLQQENILQKNKLAEILAIETRLDLIDAAEQYQNRFLQQDDAFKLMWSDISRLEKLFPLADLVNDDFKQDIKTQEKKLEKEIEALDSNFATLKSDFLRFAETSRTIHLS